MDVVYFLTDSMSYYGHEELRYSLRSLEQHVSGVRRVVVIGARARWWRNVEHVPAEDPYSHNREANIIHKMHIACRLADISRPFLFINDDHYFSRDCRAGEWPNYHQGELGPRSRGGGYSRRLVNTRRLLVERGLEALNYDVHAPILIYPEEFLQVMEAWDWVDLRGPGVVMKSVYVNSLGLPGEYMEDCKIRANLRGEAAVWAARLRQRPCWSTANRVGAVVWEILQEMYPEPSRYERTGAGA